MSGAGDDYARKMRDIAILEYEVKETKRKLYELQVSNDGYAIVLYWLDHGLLCPDCTHEVFLVWTNDDYVIPFLLALQLEIQPELKPTSQRTGRVVSMHRAILCENHAFLLEKDVLGIAYKELNKDRENFARSYEMAGWYAPLDRPEYWRRQV